MSGYVYSASNAAAKISDDGCDSKNQTQLYNANRPKTAVNHQQREINEINLLLSAVQKWSTRRDEQNKSREDYSLD